MSICGRNNYCFISIIIKRKTLINSEIYRKNLKKKVVNKTLIEMKIMKLKSIL